MAKVHDFLEVWQGSRNLCATQKESCTPNMQMTARGYISDTEEIVKASWSLFQHDGAAAFKLSERSPLPPPLSATDLPGGRTQALNVRRIRKINRHPVESDEDSASLSNGSRFEHGGYYRSSWQQPYHIQNRRFFKQTVQLSPRILVRTFSIWYIKYAALHGSSFGVLRFSISRKFSKQSGKNLIFGPKMVRFSKTLAGFWDMQNRRLPKMHLVNLHIWHTKHYILWSIFVDMIKWTVWYKPEPNWPVLCLLGTTIAESVRKRNRC